MGVSTCWNVHSTPLCTRTSTPGCTPYEAEHEDEDVGEEQ